MDHQFRRRAIHNGRRYFVRRGLWWYVLTQGRRGLLVAEAGPYATIGRAVTQTAGLEANHV